MTLHLASSVIKWKVLLRTEWTPMSNNNNSPRATSRIRRCRRRLKVVASEAYGLLPPDKPKTLLWGRCRARRKVCSLSSPNFSRTQLGVRLRLGLTGLSMLV